MSNFNPKSFQQIVAAMASKVASETPITDFNAGSVILTLLEAAAQEDFNQYIQMLQIIRGYNLDTTEGSDLDARASEYGLTRISAQAHSGYVTILDARFNKISTKLYAGLPGPTAGSTAIYVDDASLFPVSGMIYVGRNTVNTEGPISFSATPINHGSYWEIQLDTALVNDHGTDETIILSQYGLRQVSAGTEVIIPESDFSQEVSFELNQTVQLLDGENAVENVLVTALLPGGFKVPAGAISNFANPPFSGASVSNPLPFTNGRDQETDQELRDRIRDTIQALSRGTSRSIQTGIINLKDEVTNSSIVSANVIPPINLADGPTKVYIDNGRGLEPTLSPFGLETIIDSATGGEQYFQLSQFPLVKANIISQNVEPFNLSGGETLILRVGTNEETFSFESTDFQNVGSAKATEVSQAINQRATLFEARTITDSIGKRIIITPTARTNENIQLDSSSSANLIFNFSTDEVFTLKLYKNDKLLVKDGLTASMLSSAQPFDLSTTSITTTDGDITVTPNSKIISKVSAGVDPFSEIIKPGMYVKFSTDADSSYRKVKTIVSDTKLILEEAYPVLGGGLGNLIIWQSPQIEIAANGDLSETEIVSFGPTDFASSLQALASELLVRMQEEINLSTVELAVNNTKLKVLSNLENSSNSKMQIVGGGAALALGYCTTQALTGSLTFNANSKEVSGAGTQFLGELQEGQWIKANLDGKGTWTKIESIESNTKLYLTENYRGISRILVPCSKMNFSTLEVGSNKDYTLNRSNGQIELTLPLISGDSLTAGSINTRAFTDSSREFFSFDSIGSSSTLIIKVDGGFEATATTGDAISPYNYFIAENLIGFDPGLFVGFYIECISGNNIGQTDYISTYNYITGEITILNGFTNPIGVGDKFSLSQVVTFVHVSDFLDPHNATADEVIAVINRVIRGAKAEKRIDNSIRLRTSNFSQSGKIQVLGGTANQVLSFSLLSDSNQESNLAVSSTENSDRFGISSALGFTLGPDQNLVVILDGDSTNKTYALSTKISGTVTTGGSNTFTETDIKVKYLTDSFFKDFWIYWLTGANAGSLQNVLSYTASSGTFTTSTIFNSNAPTPFAAISAGDTFALVPRTSENVVSFLNDLNSTTLSISANIETTNITGDYVQISTKTPGTSGKVYVAGGTSNNIGIAIEGLIAGSPINDVNTNSKAGLTKGLPVVLTLDGLVTTADITVPYNTFRSTTLIHPTSSYYAGMEIEFLTGNNAGFKTTVLSHDNTTGEIVLVDNATNQIALSDSFRISVELFVTDIQGTSAPYTIRLSDISNNAFDVSGFGPEKSSAIRDVNGLNFNTIQVEGIDGYKYYTGLIQLAQHTIDGLDTDPNNFPGIGAAGTQFEVIPPVIIKIKLILDVTTNSGVSLSSVSNDVANTVSEYINSRKVGEDIILSEIIAAAMGVTGVFDVSISNYSSNITIADGELARVDLNDIIVG